MTPDPGAQPSEEGEQAPAKKGFGAQQIVATVLTVAVLVLVFAVVLPQIGDYSEAWDAIVAMSTGWLLVLLGATVFVIVAYVWPFQAALPGLKYRPAFVVRQTSFMISNVVPAGGAIGLAVQFQMLGSYGFGPAPITAAIGITSVWNTFVTLALPVVGLLALVALGAATSEAVLVTIIGVVAIAVGVTLFALILRSEDTARRIGAWADRVVAAAARLVRREADLHLDQAVVDFRSSIVDVVSQRWPAITGSNVLQQLAQFSVLFVAVLGIQGGTGEITLAEAFAAFAFGRLATFIPIPPGGLGTTDAIISGALIAFGMDSGDALAAVLIWRGATYFPQVILGGISLIGWRHRENRRLAEAS